MAATAPARQPNVNENTIDEFGVAVHEVGHGLTCVSLLGPEFCTELSIVPDRNSLGFMVQGKRGPLVTDIAIFFGGGIAEHRFDPSVYGYRSIEWDAQMVAGRLNADPLRIQTAMHGLIVSQKAPDIHAGVLLEGYSLATSILEQRWDEVLRLAKHLCEMKVMKTWDIWQHFESEMYDLRGVAV
jgi:hypothetical protein